MGEFVAEMRVLPLLESGSTFALLKIGFWTKALGHRRSDGLR